MKRRQFGLGVGIATLGLGEKAGAASYPSGPIRLVVPFPPGGNVDTVSRRIVNQLSAELGTPVIIDNRAGASGIIGSEFTARAIADGSILLMAGSNHGINPSIYRRLPYDTVRDFAPIGLIGSIPMALVVSQELGVRTYTDLIRYGRENPNSLKFGVTLGSAAHLASVLFLKQAGIEALLVPYRGDGPTVSDLLGNHINCYIGITSLLKEHIESGRLPPIAVTSAQRTSLFPELPTLRELGMTDYEVGSWNGLFASSAVPDAILDVVASALHRTLSNPEVSSSLSGMGMHVVNGDRRILADFLQREITRWTAMVEETGIERQ